MTTASTAFAAIKTRLTNNKPSAASVLRWQNEDSTPLPDTPASFIYTEFMADKAELKGFGGGTGANLWRNPAQAVFYCFVPRGDGLSIATDLAEAVATLFRGYRDSNIQCFEATNYPLGSGLSPPGLKSEVDNYYCAVCEVSFHFDLIG